jgi:hypothetical protein
MHDSDRLKRDTGSLTKWLLRALIALVILSVGGAVIVRGLTEQSEYEWSSNQRNSEYTAEAYGPAYDACLRLTDERQPDCITKANNEYRENERKEQDLIAQQTTAVWTFLMGCAAIIGMMLSALGVYLVWTTFEETRKSNDISNNNLRLQSALVFPKLEVIPEINIQLRVSDEDWKPQVLSCMFHNGGQTDALSVCLKDVRISIPEMGLENVELFPRNLENAVMVVGSHGENGCVYTSYKFMVDRAAVIGGSYNNANITATFHLEFADMFLQKQSEFQRWAGQFQVIGDPLQSLHAVLQRVA